MLVISRRHFLRIGACCAATALLGATSGCKGENDPFSPTRKIIDDVGREVEIPRVDKLGKVYFTSPLAQIFCFTVATDLLGGTASSFSREQLDYLPEGSENLVNMGSLSGNGSIDIDVLKESGIQLIFSISGTDLTDVNIEDALALQEQSGIPVVLIDGSFDCIGDTYRLLGECLGRKERAEVLAQYCEDIYKRVTEAVAAVPESERVSYLFAEGPDGLLTEPDVSQHSIAFNVAGGVNVAGDVDPNETGRRAGKANNYDMVNISIDEVRAWDPEVIITWDSEKRSGAESLIRVSSNWSDVSAVKNDRVYAMPSLPFAFCDRPPGINRFLGIQWLANLFYPQYFDVDMVEVVRDFYATCYWREISEQQAKHILGLDD